MDKAIEFAQKNFKTNNFEITEKTLKFVYRSLTDINNSIPKEFVNDLSVVDMGKLQDKEIKEIFQVSVDMKNNKKEKLTSLLKDMAEVDKKGLNLFEVSKNINELGVKTISIEDIAKAVVEDPSIKSEVLESAEKGISPEEFAEQLKEAEKLGISESTQKVTEAAKASGFTRDVMPSLETMKSDFDAEAHNLQWLKWRRHRGRWFWRSNRSHRSGRLHRNVTPKSQSKQTAQAAVLMILSQVIKLF